jgi:hypothetical protein
MVPDSRINSWVSWFIFNLWKININQYYESDPLSAGVATQYVNTWKYKMAMHDNYCTYLNCGLLEAPHKYILHGLVPGLNWTLFWPHHKSMYLVATPSSVSCCLLQGFKFHTKCPSSIWVASQNVQANITTTLPDTCYMYIYTCQYCYYSFLPSTHLPFSWAGWLPLTRTVRYNTCRDMAHQRVRRFTCKDKNH